MKMQLIQFLFVCFHISHQFNIDTNFPTIFTNSPEAYFGFSVLLHYNQADKWQLLVGAPKGNQSFSKSLKQPGNVFKCSYEHERCEEVRLETYGNTIAHNYHDQKNNSWLGVNLIENSDQTVVTCAHRWKNQLNYQLWRSQPNRSLYPIQDYYSNGLCYSISKDLKANTAKRHIPLINITLQVADGIANFCFGMAGMSSHFTSDGKLLLGAPGAFNWEGKLVTVDGLSRRNEDSVVWSPVGTYEPLHFSMYLGYSVTSGKFYSATSISYVVGAPRYRYFGKIYIVNSSATPYEVEFSWQGKQFGEYFGASLCTIDLNLDGFDDLIVGSPLYSKVSDEGKAYLFINKEGKGFEEPIELFGSKAENARFGTTIAAIGDINLDAIPDFAVGAPYEDGAGVVYIYSGDTKEKNYQKMTQRLEAKTINSNLKGFGISIAAGKDIDRNHYLDIAIGSYESGQAVVLRSLPTVSIEASITTNPTQLNISSYPCTYQNQKVGCLSIKICMKYESPKTLRTVDVISKLSFDTMMSDESKRGFFYNEGIQSLEINKKEKLQGRHKNCSTYEAFLKRENRNYLTPIEITYEFQLPEQAKDAFCAFCPVLNPKSESSVKHLVFFLNGCGEDKLCNSDLHLTVLVVDHQSNQLTNPKIWIGLNKTITFSISVSNTLEAAYITELNITVPKWSNFDRKPISTSCNDGSSQDKHRFMICDIGNPLLDGTKVSFEVDLNVEMIPQDVKEVNVEFKVTTSSVENNDVLEDNYVAITVASKMSADITIYGSTPDEYISYANSSSNKIALISFTHVYEVVNLGPSPLESARVMFDVPEMSKDGKLQFIKNIVLQTRDGTKTAIVTQCRGANTNYLTNDGKDKYFDQVPRAVKRKKRSSGDTESKKNSKLFCEQAKCRQIECDIAKMASNDGVKIDIQLEIDVRLLDELKLKADIIDYMTEAKTVILNAPSNIQPPNHQPDSAIVFTSFDTGRTSPKKMPPWVIPVSIVLGILLLIALAALFYKLGFFHRADRDALKQAQQEGTTDAAEPCDNATFSSQNNLVDSEK